MPGSLASAARAVARAEPPAGQAVAPYSSRGHGQVVPRRDEHLLTVDDLDKQSLLSSRPQKSGGRRAARGRAERRKFVSVTRPPRRRPPRGAVAAVRPSTSTRGALFPVRLLPGGATAERAAARAAPTSSPSTAPLGATRGPARGRSRRPARRRTKSARPTATAPALGRAHNIEM